MLNKETIIRRLTLAKYLYGSGLAQSKLHESVAFSSLLMFHDAVEMFLKLAAEKQNVKSDKFGFIEYWDKLEGLTLKESMRHLNERRVNLKHRGILPAKADLEITRVNVTDFFEQNCKPQFDIAFNEITLVHLVNDAEVVRYLKAAESSLQNGKVDDCVEKAAYAFFVLLEKYESSKKDEFHYRRSPFSLGEDLKWWWSDQMEVKKISDKIADQFERLHKAILEIQQSVKIMSFEIDYRKYSMFKLLTPMVTRAGDELYAELWMHKKWTPENCRFCIDFVIECSLKLQDFDFNLKEVVEVEEFIMVYESGNFKDGLHFNKVPIPKSDMP